MVSDGDSKAYITVFDVYGVCELCNKVKSKFTNVRDSGFSDWVKSEEYARYAEEHEKKTHHVRLCTRGIAPTISLKISAKTWKTWLRC